MSNRTLIVASNDIGFKDVPEIRKLGIEAASGEFGFSGGLVEKIHSEKIEIEVVPLQVIVERLKARLSLGARVDGVCLLSCSPYGNGTELLEPVYAIRSLPDQLESFPGVFAKTVPIVLSDLQSIIGRRTLKPADHRWVATVPAAATTDLGEVLNNSTKKAYELAFEAMRSWSLELIQDLEVSGVIVHRSDDGQMHARLALRRALRGGQMHSASMELINSSNAGLPIFGVDVDIDREPFAALADLITGDLYREYTKYDKTKPELLLHRMIDMNRRLITRSAYKAWISEKSLEIRNGVHRSLRPDLILRPLACQDAWTLLELKLPSANVIVDRDRNPRIARPVLKATKQVRDYARAILDPDNREEVIRKLGEVPNRIKMGILIGIRPADEPDGLLGELRAKEHLADVQVIRYNELCQYDMKLWGPESPIIRPW